MTIISLFAGGQRRRRERRLPSQEGIPHRKMRRPHHRNSQVEQTSDGGNYGKTFATCLDFLQVFGDQT